MNELEKTINKQNKLDFAQSFLKAAKQDIKDVGDRFFMLGYRLYEAQIYNYVEALGYESIEQLAEAELDLGRSSTYNLINVFKRFSERDEHYHHKTCIDSKYKNYKYSQLVEMEKALCLSSNIEEEIPPTTPVRIIKEFIKYLNKNPGHHKNLPEWQAEQEKQKQIEQLPLIQQSIPDEKPKNVIPLIEIYEQPATVQTFGLQDCAKSKYKTPIIKIRPEYNFHTRTGARAFLADYENWQPYYGFIGNFFKDMFFYTFKNNMNIYAVTIETILGNGEELHSTNKILYFLNYDKLKSKEITQNQFEKFCAKYKDKL